MGEIRDLVGRYTQAWNNHDKTGWGNAFGSDATLTAPVVSADLGRTVLPCSTASGRTRSRTNQVRIVGIFEDGSTELLQAVFEGTHTATPNVPGQLIEADRVELMAQLGMMPMPAY